VHHGPLFLSYGPPIHCPSATATCGTLPVVPFRAPGFASFTWLRRLFSAFPNARIWCSLPSYPCFPSPLVADLFHVPSSSSSLIWVSFCFSLFLVCLGLMEFAVEFFLRLCLSLGLMEVRLRCFFQVRTSSLILSYGGISDRWGPFNCTSIYSFCCISVPHSYGKIYDRCSCLYLRFYLFDFITSCYILMSNIL
jgi:hypothetical protein